MLLAPEAPFNQPEMLIQSGPGRYLRLKIELLGAGQFFRPQFTVRLYHDAQVAEVLACQHVSRFKARYDYPNLEMLLPDEKRQINLLLRDWLNLCSRRGYQNTGLLA